MTAAHHRYEGGAHGVPLWLARLHRSLPVGARITPDLPADLGDRPTGVTTASLLIGGGFGPVEPSDSDPDGAWERRHTLPDWVAPGLSTLIVGLNPSPASADGGVAFARPGNRFWPAALAAGLLRTDRDPERAVADGVGFTDLVKRTTRTAAELDADDYRAGLDRLEGLVGWLAPRVVVVVGLTGWRAARDRKATAGWQPGGLGGRPVHLMPNTSGLNAHTTLDGFVEHLRTATAGPPAGIVGGPPTV
ncbi:MAG: mismatch-specific DNA-glycosylase [Actinomycetota bacterium]